MVTRTASYHRSLGLSQAMCTSDFVFTAVACNTLGNTNYRQVWVSARFDKAVAALPDPCYALGDAAHGPSDNMLVPYVCLLYTSPSPRDKRQSRMPSSA